MKSKKSMIYAISFKRIYWGRRSNRAARAIRFLKRFVQRHFGVSKVIIDTSINEKIWERGIEKPPRHLRIRVEKIDEDTAKATLIKQSEATGSS